MIKILLALILSFALKTVKSFVCSISQVDVSVVNGPATDGNNIILKLSISAFQFPTKQFENCPINNDETNFNQMIAKTANLKPFFEHSYYSAEGKDLPKLLGIKSLIDGWKDNSEHLENYHKNVIRVKYEGTENEITLEEQFDKGKIYGDDSQSESQIACFNKKLSTTKGPFRFFCWFRSANVKVPVVYRLSSEYLNSENPVIKNERWFASEMYDTYFIVFQTLPQKRAIEFEMKKSQKKLFVIGNWMDDNGKFKNQRSKVAIPFDTDLDPTAFKFACLDFTPEKYIAFDRFLDKTNVCENGTGVKFDLTLIQTKGDTSSFSLSYRTLNEELLKIHELSKVVRKFMKEIIFYPSVIKNGRGDDLTTNWYPRVENGILFLKMTSKDVRRKVNPYSVKLINPLEDFSSPEDVTSLKNDLDKFITAYATYQLLFSKNHVQVPNALLSAEALKEIQTIREAISVYSSVRTKLENLFEEIHLFDEHSEAKNFELSELDSMAINYYHNDENKGKEIYNFSDCLNIYNTIVDSSSTEFRLRLQNFFKKISNVYDKISSKDLETKIDKIESLKSLEFPESWVSFVLRESKKNNKDQLLAHDESSSVFDNLIPFFAELKGFLDMIPYFLLNTYLRINNRCSDALPDKDFNTKVMSFYCASEDLKGEVDECSDKDLMNEYTLGKLIKAKFLYSQLLGENPLNFSQEKNEQLKVVIEKLKVFQRADDVFKTMKRILQNNIFDLSKDLVENTFKLYLKKIIASNTDRYSSMLFSYFTEKQIEKSFDMELEGLLSSESQTVEGGQPKPKDIASLLFKNQNIIYEKYKNASELSKKIDDDSYKLSQLILEIKTLILDAVIIRDNSSSDDSRYVKFRFSSDHSYGSDWMPHTTIKFSQRDKAYLSVRYQSPEKRLVEYFITESPHQDTIMLERTDSIQLREGKFVFCFFNIPNYLNKDDVDRPNFEMELLTSEDYEKDKPKAGEETLENGEKRFRSIFALTFDQKAKSRIIV